MESLTLPGVLDSLKSIRDYVARAADLAGLNKQDCYSLMLSVDETATNIIVHGYEEAGLSGNVTIESQMTSDRLQIVLEDTGKEYDPTTRDLPSEADLNLPLEERPIGGLGILLTVEGVDEYRYERVNHRNRNIFIKYLSASPNNG